MTDESKQISNYFLFGIIICNNPIYVIYNYLQQPCRENVKIANNIFWIQCGLYSRPSDHLLNLYIVRSDDKNINFS